MKKLLIIGAAATVTLAPVVSMAGTVAHWTFGANGLTDITGKNAIILENHGVAFSNGGAVFDGSSYLVTTAPIELGATSKAFTIECWAKFDAKDYLGYIFAPSDASEKGAFVVYQYVSSGTPYMYGQLRVVAPSTWQQEVGSIESLNTSYPHHIAYVVDGNGLVEVFVDHLHVIFAVTGVKVGGNVELVFLRDAQRRVVVDAGHVLAVDG